MPSPDPKPAVLTAAEEAVANAAADFSRALDALLKLAPQHGFFFAVEMLSCIADCIRQRFNADGQSALLSSIHAAAGPACGVNALKMLRNTAVLQWLSVEWQCGVLRDSLARRAAAVSKS